MDPANSRKSPLSSDTRNTTGTPTAARDDAPSSMNAPEDKNLETEKVDEKDAVDHTKPDLPTLLAQANIDDRAVLAPAMLEFVGAMRRMAEDAAASGTSPPWGDGALNSGMFSWLMENYDVFRENIDERQPGVWDDAEKMALSRAAFARLLGALFPGKFGQN